MNLKLSEKFQRTDSGCLKKRASGDLQQARSDNAAVNVDIVIAVNMGSISSILFNLSGSGFHQEKRSEEL